MADVALLKIERGRIKGSLTKLKTFADNVNAQRSIEELSIRLDKLESLEQEFKLVDDKLALNGVDSEYDAFEDKYLDIKATLRRHVNSRLNDQSTSSHSPNEQLNSTVQQLMQQQQTFFEGFPSPPNSSQVRLPKINIPTFSGDYKDWPSFKDLFESCIDSKEGLSSVHKFQYLKGVLQGEAASLIKHLPITQTSYPEAWSKLVKRYDKKSQILNSYIKTFINQPSCSQLSTTALRRLADTSDELIRGVKALGSEAKGRDPWLIHLIVTKTDSETRRLWAEQTTSGDLPSFDQFIEFLNQRCDALESCAPTVKKTNVIQQVRTLHIEATLRCKRCEEPHQLYKCPQYKNMTIPDRRNYVKQKGLCFNCLSQGHSANNCSSKFRCHTCKQAHHSSLHNSETSSQPTPGLNSLQTSTSISDYGKPENANVPQLNSYTISKTDPNRITLLPTAMVQVPNSSGELISCRVLLDCASEATFITEDCVRRLNLQREKAHVIIKGILRVKAGIAKEKVQLSLISRHDPQNALSVQAFILDDLTSPQPATSFLIKDWSFLKGYKLADPMFNTSRRNDILLGADYFMRTLRNGHRDFSPDYPSVHNTIFGYIVSGPLSMERQASHIVSLHANIDEVNETLRKFWEVEEVGSPVQAHTEEEHYCETLFSTTHRIDPTTNRYVVRLPLRESTNLLGDSLHIARSCLSSLERKFLHNHTLRDEYTQFINEYRELGHLEDIPADEPTVEHAYLPHHAVLKPTSTTTKLRVVFNGSSVTSSGVSLNDRLLVGPKVQRDLLPILLSFRTFKIAVVADIEKMFRQILVETEDRRYQRILWREKTNQPIRHLQLKTVTYGTSPAPFLATRSLKQLTIEFEGKYPLAEEALKNNFYVDDLMGGASSDAEALQLYHQLTELLRLRGFNLRKWTSNSQQFLKSTSSDSEAALPMKIDEYPESVKVLGLKWLPDLDCFTFEVNLSSPAVATKRIILSESSRIFDPLGLISPTTVTFKILLQQLWLQKYDWDDICDQCCNKWFKLRDELHHLQNLRIPRWIHAHGKSLELHGFSDASEAAYAAVIYCRSVDKDNRVSVKIVSSKTRVAPIKQLSIPRLELCGATLLANLMASTKTELKMPDRDCFAWTDSTVVLAWLSSPPRRWKSFVGNRTSTILSILPRTQWNHVPSAQNPADLASRGLLSSELVQSRLWWDGPKYLKDDWKEKAKDAPLEDKIIVAEEQRERYLEVLICETTNDTITDLFEKYSTLNKIIRIIARCFQYCRKCNPRKRNPHNNQMCTTWITSEDIRSAYRGCILWAQSSSFGKEIHSLQSNSPLHSSSRLLTLTPFLDTTNILRVGGRLDNTNLPYSARHPAILPKDHIFTLYLIADMHTKHLHAGTSLLLSIIRQEYWILSCRTLVKSCINKCFTCVKNRAATSNQLMAHLPSKRVGAYRAFENVGVDYAGPLTLLQRRGRGARTSKGYLVIFVCFSTRAMHLELAGDLTADTFVAALKRFTARRGIPCNVYSDNGTNFVGANRYLNELHQALLTFYQDPKITNFVSSCRIQWHFNPPAAPHFGGIWETGVRSVKKILKRTLGETKLTYEEMNSLLIQIEGLLNSRPLIPVHDDPSCLDALTPAHFLIGQPLTVIPESRTCDGAPSLHNRWRLMQHIHQHFWKRWSADYLSLLQRRPKWQKIDDNLNINDMVVIKDNNLPPSKWSLGRIIDTHPGKDNLVRVVTIRTAHGTFKRPITQLCKLPVNTS